MKNAPDQTTAESALELRNDTPTDLFPDTLPPVVAARIPTPGTRAAEALQALIHGPQNQAEYEEGGGNVE
jgi:hypothetical protein